MQISLHAWTRNSRTLMNDFRLKIFQKLFLNLYLAWLPRNLSIVQKWQKRPQNIFNCTAKNYWTNTLLLTLNSLISSNYREKIIVKLIFKWIHFSKIRNQFILYTGKFGPWQGYLVKKILNEILNMRTKYLIFRVKILVR